MPKVPTTPTRRPKPEPGTNDAEPYMKPEPRTPRSATPADGNGNGTPSTSPSKKSPSKPQPWSDRERLALVNAALKDAKIDFEAASKETGRPVTALRDQWRKIVLAELRGLYGGDVKGNYVGRSR